MWQRLISGRTQQAALRAQVDELEARLDHERLFPREWAHRRIRDHFGSTVMRGPFKGLTYPDWGLTHVDAFSNRIIGSYEEELHPSIERLISQRPPVVVNIGCADGYYAVGLARRLPQTTVEAFEIEPDRQQLARHLADHNGVGDRVRVHGLCDHETLQEVAAGAVIVIDCEGCEVGLLDPERVPALRTSSMLIEAHDLIVAGTTETLRRRFAETHAIDVVPTRPRWVNDYPELEFLPLVTRQIAIEEFRGAPMHWLILTPQPT